MQKRLEQIQQQNLEDMRKDREDLMRKIEEIRNDIIIKACILAFGIVSAGVIALILISKI